MFNFIKYHINLSKAMKEETNEKIISLKKEMETANKHNELVDSMFKEDKAS